MLVIYNTREGKTTNRKAVILDNFGKLTPGGGEKKTTMDRLNESITLTAELITKPILKNKYIVL